MTSQAEAHDPLLVFIHIRKTAGQSLRSVLLREYGGRSGTRLLENHFAKPDSSFASVQALVANLPEDLRAVHGHILFWPEIEWPAGTRFVTMLRDPVERTISHYYWLKERNPDLDLSLAEAIEAGEIHDNLQTRVLAADDSPVGELSTGALDLAARALGRFDVIGLTEQFDASLVLMGRTFGWARLPHARVNVTANRKPREEIDAETIRLIERHNALDRKLYRRAQKLFARQLQRQPGDFMIEVAALAAASAAPGDPAVGNLRPPPAVQDIADAEQLRSALVIAEAELLRREASRVAAEADAAALETLAERVPRLEEALASEHESAQRKADLNEALRRELRELRAAHAQQVTELKRMHSTQLTNMRTELRDLRSAHAEQIAKLKRLHAEQVERAEGKATDRLLADTERRAMARASGGQLPAVAGE